MKRLILIFSLLVSLALPAMVPSSDRALASQYQSFLKNQEDDSALSLLKSIPQESPLFVWALSESARLLYVKERWPEFFAVALYARTVYPDTSVLRRLRKLEILGLIRHCQWDRAKEAAQDALKSRQANSPKSHEAEFVSLLESVELLATLPSLTQPARDQSKRPYLLPLSLRWKIPTSSLTMVDPFKLRRPLDPQCESQPETPVTSREEGDSHVAE